MAVGMLCQGFAAELRKVFKLTSSESDLAQGILNLWQGTRQVTDYLKEFWALAVESWWNSSA